MTRAERIEEAAREVLQWFEPFTLQRPHHPSLSTRLESLDAALALPSEPGECCRRAAEAMREAAVHVADERADAAEEAAREWLAKDQDATAEDLYAEAQNSREIADRIRALPLPPLGAKETK